MSLVVPTTQLPGIRLNTADTNLPLEPFLRQFCPILGSKI
jgi:hypothetical protein